ncbi:hypothetical protein [Sphingomonas sp. CCH16-B10]|nr:hypothetical protein [Sphingomonas sp. CCH16-B10]
MAIGAGAGAFGAAGATGVDATAGGAFAGLAGAVVFTALVTGLPAPAAGF